MDSALGERVKLFKLRSAEHAPSIDASALSATAHKLRFARCPAKAVTPLSAARCLILLPQHVLDQHLVFGGTHGAKVIEASVCYRPRQAVVGAAFVGAFLMVSSASMQDPRILR